MLGSIFNSDHFSGNFITFFSSILLIVRLNFLSRLLQFIRVLSQIEMMTFYQFKMVDLRWLIFPLVFSLIIKNIEVINGGRYPSPTPYLHPGPLQEAKTSPICLRLSVISIVISVYYLSVILNKRQCLKNILNKPGKKAKVSVLTSSVISTFNSLRGPYFPITAK